jgi:lytic murein transglycosylase
MLLATAAMISVSAAAQPEFNACLSELRAGAPERGISTADFDRVTRASRWQAVTFEKSQRQPEFTIDWSTYLARVVTAQRVDTGRQLMSTWQTVLATVSASYKVDPAVVLAIWGIESNYGQSLGEVPVLDAWLTRSCLEPRKPLWRANVYSAAKLLRDGVVSADEFKGSWSGAFGLTQFIPTSFEKFARDGDGDGRIDLYGSVPDALASTANHLARSTKWQRGVPTAVEVRFPARLLARLPQGDVELRDPNARTFAAWATHGVTRIDGAALQMAPPLRQTKAMPFFPEGVGGRVFLVTPNFDALLAYNRSTKYALAVALVAAAIEAP